MDEGINNDETRPERVWDASGQRRSIRKAVAKTSKTWKQTEELAAKYIAGKLIYLPQDLIEYAFSAEVANWGDKKRRIEFKEGLLCMWAIAHAGFYEETAWKYIHTSAFKPIFSDTKPIRNAKDCLIAGGFLTENSSFSEGFYPMSYLTHYSGKIVPYEIQSRTKKINKILARQDWDCELFEREPILRYQRKQLDKLKVDVETVTHIATHLITMWTHGVDTKSSEGWTKQVAGESTKTKRQLEIEEVQRKKILRRTKKIREKLAEANLSNDEREKLEEEIAEITESPMSDSEKLSTFALPVMKILYQKGTLTIGRRSGRVFSPLTQLGKDFREAISWDIKGLSGDWEIIDLKCSQPTLIAYTSGDEVMKKHCEKDLYYQRIADWLGQSRSEAKVSFCQYAFGRNRPKETKANKAAWEIQRMMKEYYPYAHQYIWEGKKDNHKDFIAGLQQRESEIFIRDIFPILMKKKIPAISIHDGLFVPIEYGDEVYRIAVERLYEQPEKITQPLSRETAKKQRRPKLKLKAVKTDPADAERLAKFNAKRLKQNKN